MPLEEVFQHLRCTKDGLTSEDAQERLTLFGHNKLEEKQVRNVMYSKIDMMLTLYSVTQRIIYNVLTKFTHTELNKFVLYRMSSVIHAHCLCRRASF